MMSLTISNISAILKKIIVPTIQDQLPKENVLFNKIKKNVGVRVANNQIYVAARSGRHSGIYSAAEGSEPFTGKAKYQQPYTDMKYLFGTLELTDQAIEATKGGDVKAIASILATEITALKDDMKADLNRILNGDGNGKLCLTNGTGAASTTLLVDGNPAGLAANFYVAEGMQIQFGTGSTVEVSALVGSTGITLASASTWSNDVTITKAYDDEPMGIAGIIDDGDNVATIQNLARSTNSWCNAATYDTATTLTEANMIDVYLQTKQYGGAKVITMGKTLFAKYGALLTSMKKTRDLKEVLSGGWKGLEFMGGDVGVMLDFDCWDGYVQMIDFDALTLAEMSEPFAWLEADAYGGILKRSSSNRTIWEGTLKYYFNLVGLKFKSSGRMSGQTA
jgi:hypothetical protein